MEATTAQTAPGHHERPAAEVVRALGGDPAAGLHPRDVAERRERYGPNILPADRRRGPLLRFLRQFHSPLIYVLLVSAAITGLLGEHVDAAVILGVVIANAIVGFAQEARAERALAALAAMTRATVTVVRAGRRLRAPSADLVPGDLVVLEAGDKVTADLRLIETRELTIDESALTGESAPVPKDPRALPGAALADRRDMAYSGTLVTYGAGTGIVVATGAATELGLIHRLVGQATAVRTPLTRKIARFSRIVTVAILALSAVTFLFGVARGRPAADMLTAAVALAVGAIPEGLPAVVTITLAFGVARMVRRNVIVRRLPAVETLGSTTVICTDKTGTLTENQMTVTTVVAAGRTYELTGTGYGPDGEIRPVGVPAEEAPTERNIALRECLLAGLFCNDARLVDDGDGHWAVAGDPTEGALVASAAKAGLPAAPPALPSTAPSATPSTAPSASLSTAPSASPSTAPSASPSTAPSASPSTAPSALPSAAAPARLDTVPFTSERRFMATLHRGGDGRGIVYLKGSVERVLELCDRRLGPGGRAEPLGRDEIAEVLAAARDLGARALRVLAFARGDVAPEVVTLTELPRTAFLGLQAMYDPPRDTAATAVLACRTAGVQVKMITGDHAATAQAIGSRLGLDGPVMTGAELAECPDGELPAAADRTAVFARVSPEQKLRLVEALQSRGHVIAMTGDGVNDAPALKRADIGVAMGRSGTEVAKEAADMVLIDDNFASIRAAVEEGRGVFDNLVKFIVWALPANIGLGLVLVAGIVAGTELPILPLQVLWLNMTAVLVLGLPFSVEPGTPEIMNRPPRDPARPLLTGDLAGRILLVSAILLAGAFGLFHWERAAAGASLDTARTVVVNVFALTLLTYLFNCLSLDRPLLWRGVRRNPWVAVGALTLIGIQLLYTYAPPMNELFRSAPLSAGSWLLIALVAIAAYGAVEIAKAVRPHEAEHPETSA